MRLLGTWLLTLTVLLHAIPASAANKEAKERAAKKACLTGDPTRGVEILADLYIDTDDTTYIFNQGRCFEQNRHYEDAIGRFREYLIKTKDISAEDKAYAEKHIEACESYLGLAKASPAGTAPTSISPAAPTTQSILKETTANPSSPEVSIQQHSTTVATAATSDGSSLRTAGAVSAIFGGVALIAAVALNLKVNSMSSDLEKNYDSSRDSVRRDYKTAGWIGYGVGATFLIGGSVLYYLGWEKGRNFVQGTAFVPVFSHDFAGAVLTESF